MKVFSTLMLMGLAITSLHSADNWVPTPTPLPISSTIHSFPGMGCSRSPVSGFLATWGDYSLDFPPTYAIYNEISESWGAVHPIPGGQQSTGQVFPCMGNSFALVGWADPTTTPSLRPVTSTYNGGISFTNTLPIPGSVSVHVNSPVYSSFDSSTQTFFVSWLDDATRLPFYTTTTDGINWIPPTAPTFIDGSELIGTSTDFKGFVLSASDSAGKFMVVWKDGQIADPSAYYAIYDVGTTSFSTPATKIAGLNSGDASTLVFPSFDPNSSRFMATWVDVKSSLPTYTLLTLPANTWSPNPPLPIPGATAAEPAAVTSALDTTTNRLLFTWLDGLTAEPIYTFYNGSWSSSPYPLPIPGSSAADSPPFVAFDGRANPHTFMVTWTELSGTLPFESRPIYDTLVLSGKIPTQTTVTTVPSSAANKSSVDIKIKVTTMGQGTPTGSVTLKINGKKFGTAMLNKQGVAHFTTCNLHKGDLLKAIYNGSGNFLPSNGTLIVN